MACCAAKTFQMEPVVLRCLVKVCRSKSRRGWDRQLVPGGRQEIEEGSKEEVLPLKSLESGSEC